MGGGCCDKDNIIAHPSEKGGYNEDIVFNVPAAIIAHPSEKGGYNIAKMLRVALCIIAHPSEKGIGDIYLDIPKKLNNGT